VAKKFHNLQKIYKTNLVTDLWKTLMLKITSPYLSTHLGKID